MHTINLQIQDDLYEAISNKGLDINNKIKEFLLTLVDDSYPSISTDDAKLRVNDAMQRYKNQTGSYLNQEQYSTHMSNKLNNLKIKYENH